MPTTLFSTVIIAAIRLVIDRPLGWTLRAISPLYPSGGCGPSGGDAMLRSDP